MLALQAREQIEDLRLHGDIECAHRLVTDEQARLEDHRARDADALALPPGELVRIAAHQLRPQANAHEHLLHLARTCPGREARLMELEWLRDDPTDPHAWIEAGERVLEDDLQVTAQMLELRCRQIREGPPQPGHAARARADELQCRPREGRLPRARLSDHTQRLSRMQLEADIVQCREHATARAPRAG